MSSTNNTETFTLTATTPKCFACGAEPTGVHVYPRTEGKRADLACAAHANVKVPAPRKSRTA